MDAVADAGEVRALRAMMSKLCGRGREGELASTPSTAKSLTAARMAGLVIASRKTGWSSPVEELYEKSGSRSAREVGWKA